MADDANSPVAGFGSGVPNARDRGSSAGARRRAAEPAGKAGQSPGLGPVWTRAAAATSSRLTVDEVVEAAIALADREGLSAVSVRRVTEDLKVRPMRLYSFISRKDDLVELMIDHVTAEMLLESPPEDWRAAVHEISQRAREVNRRHPWLLASLGQRSGLGPNAVRHIEQSLTAVAALGLTAERTMDLLSAVDSYTLGDSAMAFSVQETRRRDLLDEQEWHEVLEQYVDKMRATDEFPHLAALGTSYFTRAEKTDDAFHRGLDWLLDGFEHGAA